jgi:phospholipase/carboxylesterase
MSSFFTLEGPSFGPAAGGRPRSLVLLLHGLGADGNDLIQLAPLWAEMLPGTEFLSPHAPFPCDMAPYGRQWFSLQDRDPAVLLAGVGASAPILDAFIDASLEARGLGDSALALVGFSQGTMMSLYVAPRRAKAIAGIVGFSGAMVGPDRLAAEAKSKPPVLLVHGDADQVVPFGAMAVAEKSLHQAGIAVTTERRPGLQHSIDEAGLAKAGAFLARVLPR